MGNAAEGRDRHPTFLGLEKRISWGNAVEIATIIALAALAYGRFDGAAEDVEEIKPKVAKLEGAYPLVVAETKGMIAQIGTRLDVVERNADEQERRIEGRLERLETKIDRLLERSGSRRRDNEP